MQARKCLFCGNGVGHSSKSREHVLPVWLLESLGGKNSDIFQGTHMTFPGLVRSHRRQGARTIVQGQVCRACNGGWLSQMENRVKPLIVSMNRDSKVALRSEELRLLGIWAYKTASLINITSNYRQLFTGRSFRSFYIERAPTQSYMVELGLALNASGTEMRWRQSNIQFLLVNDEQDVFGSLEQIRNHSCVITLQVGRVLFQVVGLPSPAWVSIPSEKPLSVELWPNPPEVLDWPLPIETGTTIDVMNVSPSIRMQSVMPVQVREP